MGPPSKKTIRTSTIRIILTIKMKMTSLCMKINTDSNLNSSIRTNTINTIITMMILVTIVSTLLWTSPSFKTQSTSDKAPTLIWARAPGISNLNWRLTECLTKDKEYRKLIIMSMEMIPLLILMTAPCFWAQMFLILSKRRASRTSSPLEADKHKILDLGPQSLLSYLPFLKRPLTTKVMSTMNNKTLRNLKNWRKTKFLKIFKYISRSSLYH